MLGPADGNWSTGMLSLGVTNGGAIEPAKELVLLKGAGSAETSTPEPATA